MNAHKAIELGFADDILADEKKQANDTAYSFSGRKVEMALLNKLTAKCKAAVKAEAPEPAAEPETPVTPTEPEETGTPITELDKRLELLK